MRHAAFLLLCGCLFHICKSWQVILEESIYPFLWEHLDPGGAISVRYWLPMAELTHAYLDQRFDAVLESVREGFAEQRQRSDRVESNLTTLTTSVDRFAKLFTDMNQEVAVLRQQLRDAEERIDRLELMVNAT